MAEHPGRRLDGGLIADKRSSDEAVVVMWLVPARDTDETPGRVLAKHVIVGVLHINRGTGSDIQVNGKDRPLLTSPLGISTLPVQEAEVGEDLREVVEKLRRRLCRPQTDNLALLNGVASRFHIHVFKKGEAIVDANWALSYGGRAYPLRAGVAA